MMKTAFLIATGYLLPTVSALTGDCTDSYAPESLFLYYAYLLDYQIYEASGGNAVVNGPAYDFGALQGDCTAGSPCTFDQWMESVIPRDQVYGTSTPYDSQSFGATTSPDPFLVSATVCHYNWNGTFVWNYYFAPSVYSALPNPPTFANVISRVAENIHSNRLYAEVNNIDIDTNLNSMYETLNYTQQSRIYAQASDKFNHFITSLQTNQLWVTNEKTHWNTFTTYQDLDYSESYFNAYQFNQQEPQFEPIYYKQMDDWVIQYKTNHAPNQDAMDAISGVFSALTIPIDTTSIPKAVCG